MCALALLRKPVAADNDPAVPGEPLRLDGVWQAGELAREDAVTPCGLAALAAELPGGGWPLGQLTEVLQIQAGQHEWRRLAPGLAARCARVPGPVVLVQPPHRPFGPGLQALGLDSQRLLVIDAPQPAQQLWVAEQALRCADAAAVVAWLPQASGTQLRRLQLAAQEHQALAFVLRDAPARHESSAAPLRLLVGAAAGGDDLAVEILKRRGPVLARPLALGLPAGPLAQLLDGPLARRLDSPRSAGRRPPARGRRHAVAGGAVRRA